MVESDILVLRPSKWSAIGMLIVFTLLVAGGGWLAGDERRVDWIF